MEFTLPLDFCRSYLLDMALTDVKIRNAKPKQKPYKLGDGDGLHLLVRSNGAKYWQFRYQFAGKEKTASFGAYPKVRLAEARQRRAEAERLLRDCVDPNAKKKQDKLDLIYRDRNSFGAVAEEWLERNCDSWSERYTKEINSRLANHLLPSLGQRAIADIKPLEVLTVIQRLERRGKTEMSHRILQICKSVCDFAVITGRLENNPTASLAKALKRHKVTHYPIIPVQEIPEFLSALDNLKAGEQSKLAFRILLYTAVRTCELRYSKWSDVDFQAREWRIRAEVMKMRSEHIVPLSRQVLEFFRQLHDLTGHSEWLVPTQCGYVHKVMCENTINVMIKKMGYKGRIVGHGFRSLFSTVLNEHGFRIDAIERQLAHVDSSKVRAIYNRAEYLEERRELMQFWADFLESKQVAKNGNPLLPDRMMEQYHFPPAAQNQIIISPGFGGLNWMQ